MSDIRTGEFNIYLAGGMSNMSFEEYFGWRRDIRQDLLNVADGCKKYRVCDPTQYYNFENPTHESEREVMEFDLWKVRNSDLLIVNFNSPSSLGTMSEMAIAYERKIPIIGLLLNDDKEALHPWQIEMCNRIFSNMKELEIYVRDYYLM